MTAQLIKFDPKSSVEASKSVRSMISTRMIVGNLAQVVDTLCCEERSEAEGNLMFDHCGDIDSWIQDFVDEELGAVQSEMLSQHISHCPNCMRKMLEYKHLKSLAASLKQEEIPAGVAQRLRSRLAKECSFHSIHDEE